MRRSAWMLPSFFLIATGTLAADQALKLWIAKTLQFVGASLPIVPGHFALTYTQNFGAAWSLLWGHRGVLIGIASAVTLGIVIYAVRLKERHGLHMAGLGFLLGGALGNLIDRARLGYVVDMFDLQNNGQNIFPIFNIADIAIDVGVGLLLLYNFLGSRREAKRKQVGTSST